MDLRDAGDRLKVKRRRVMMNNFTNELELDGVEVPAVNLIGEEGEGLRQNTVAHCDATARLPIGSRMESLNVSNAAAVALYAARVG